MTGADLLPFAPIALPAVAAVVLMAVIAVRRSHLAAAVISFLGLAGAFAAIPSAATAIPRQIGVLLVVDRFALVVTGILVATAAAVVLLTFAYLRRVAEPPEELYLLLLIATFGASLLAAADHLVALFIGLETLSIALYGAIGYTRRRGAAVGAALMYLVIAAASSAFLLFGAALLYAGTGTMRLGELTSRLAALDPVLAAGALLLVLVAVGFKLGAAPFHLWTPDVYRGAPAPVTAFVASVSKAGVVAVLLRLYATLGAPPAPVITAAVGLLAVASIVVGNLLAVREQDLKRLLAYSSIAHIGYLLVALLPGGERAAAATLVYLLTYLVATVASFGVVSALTGADGRERLLLADYRGLAWRRPILALGLAAAVASLAGLPLTAGFVGKLYAVLSAANAALWIPVLALVAGSVVGVYYYLRIIFAMLTPADDDTPEYPVVPVAAAVALTVAVGLVIWFGVFPSVVASIVAPAVAGLM